jgi:hypothetical protein
MTVHEQTIAKIRRLPEPLVQEVSNFIDFLLLKQDRVAPHSIVVTLPPPSWAAEPLWVVGLGV